MRITRARSNSGSGSAQARHGHEDRTRRPSHVGLCDCESRIPIRDWSGWVRRRSRRSGAARRAKSCVAALDDLIGPALVGCRSDRDHGDPQKDGFPDQAQSVHEGRRRDGALGHRRQGAGRARLSTAGRQGARGDSDQDDDRRVRAAPRSLAGRAVPELGRAVLEGQGGARSRWRSRAGGSRAERGRPGYSDHD